MWEHSAYQVGFCRLLNDRIVTDVRAGELKVKVDTCLFKFFLGGELAAFIGSLGKSSSIPLFDHPEKSYTVFDADGISSACTWPGAHISAAIKAQAM